MTNLELATIDFSNELEMQELEPMEAPGWWTAAGVAAGIVITSIVAYSGVVAVSAITT